MKSLIIYGIFYVIMMAFVGRTTIQLWPFKISFAAPLMPIGITLMLIGYFLIFYHQNREGFNEGSSYVIELVKEANKPKTDSDGTN